MFGLFGGKPPKADSRHVSTMRSFHFCSVVDEDEARLALPSMPQNLKCVSSKQLAVPPMESHVHEVLCDLLNALTVVVVTREGTYLL